LFALSVPLAFIRPAFAQTTWIAAAFIAARSRTLGAPQRRRRAEALEPVKESR